MTASFNEFTREQKNDFKKAIFAVTDYEPHFAQETIHFTDWTYFVAPWGRRSGKTHSASQEAISELAIPDRRIWIVAPNYALCDKVFREVWQAVVMDQALGSDVIAKKSYDKNSGYSIRMKWGSWIEGKSADSPNSLVGEGLDLLIMDEAAKIHPMIWEKFLEPTLLDRKGRCLMISTPEGHNWFWEAYTRGTAEETQAKGWRCSQMKSSENPHIDPTEIEKKRAEVTLEIFRQEYEASFEHHTGLIYKEFSDHKTPHGHLFDDDIFKVKDWWTHFRSIDPGLRHPTACLWAAVDPDGNVYVYQDYEVSDILASAHAAAIQIQTRFPIENTFIDPAAARTSPTDGKTVADVFESSGLYCMAAPNDVEAGVQTVAAYFAATLDKDSSKPKLYIHENCRKLRVALKQFVWDDWASLQDKAPPDRAKDRNKDLPDALRYLLASNPYFDPLSHIPQEMPQLRRPQGIPGRPQTGL